MKAWVFALDMVSFVALYLARGYLLWVGLLALKLGPLGFAECCTLALLLSVVTKDLGENIAGRDKIKELAGKNGNVDVASAASSYVLAGIFAGCAGFIHFVLYLTA